MKPSMLTVAALATLLALAMPGRMVTADEPGKESPTKQIARMVYYSGQVQGVGFRATAERIAKDYPVTGWVKNLADGRVQMVVEGPEDAVKKFLAAVRTHWKKNIEKEKVEERKPTGEYKGFTIRR